MEYAGDVAPKAAWEILSREPGAVLVDCRSRAEWSFVGVPDLSPLGKRTALVEWQAWPSMTVNPGFAEQVRQATSDPNAPVVFICRSGARSKAAAIHMTSQGFRRCYNLEGGFEGPLDHGKHRGVASGWKAAGLPWVQE
jgi:rhodanese-related sulfurtransferase